MRKVVDCKCYACSCKYYACSCLFLIVRNPKKPECETIELQTLNIIHRCCCCCFFSSIQIELKNIICIAFEQEIECLFVASKFADYSTKLLCIIQSYQNRTNNKL